MNAGAQIRWLMGRVHVGTSNAEVERDIRERCTKAGATEAQTAECVAYALKCHKDNRKLYNHVMRDLRG